MTFHRADPFVRLVSATRIEVVTPTRAGHAIRAFEIEATGDVRALIGLPISVDDIKRLPLRLLTPG